MRRALVEALDARERDEEAREALRPTLILAPGQDPPEDWNGDVIQIQAVNGRKN